MNSETAFEKLLQCVIEQKTYIKRLEKDLAIVQDHPLVMEQGGTSSGDRAVSVINKLQAKNERLKSLAEFGDRVLGKVKECVAHDGFEIEACEIADMAVAAGLMQFVPYDPKVHGDAGIEGELGDNIYWWGANPPIEV